MADTKGVSPTRKAPAPRTAATRGRAAAPGKATYVYCIVQGDAPPSAARAPEGLPGTGPVRVLDAGSGMWVLAADAPRGSYGAEAIEKGLKDLEWVSARAVAHERVVEHALGLGTVLPLKLFTLFDGDERALTHVAERRRSLQALARRVRGRREWGVRLSVDAEEAARAVRKGSAAAGRGASRGTAYLMRKTREQTLARDLVRGAGQEADEAYTALGKLAAAARRRPPAADGLVLDAAFLVDEKEGPRFARAVERLRRTLARRGLRVALTGPWPAYNFMADA
jgi:hypothetical protein